MKEWYQDSDGRKIYSNDFEHDVCLTVSGDFETPTQRKMYVSLLIDKLNSNNAAVKISTP